MSSSIVMKVWPGERAECGWEVKNGWGSAPVIWQYMGHRYFGAGFSWLGEKNCAQICPLANQRDKPEHLRAVLAMTFDHVYIAAKDYAQAASDIRKFLADLGGQEMINHWPLFAKLLEDGPDCPAIGIWHTTVTEEPFSDGTDEYGKPLPFDWSKAWSLYDDAAFSAVDSASVAALTPDCDPVNKKS